VATNSMRDCDYSAVAVTVADSRRTTDT